MQILVLVAKSNISFLCHLHFFFKNTTTRKPAPHYYLHIILKIAVYLFISDFLSKLKTLYSTFNDLPLCASF